MGDRVFRVRVLPIHLQRDFDRHGIRLRRAQTGLHPPGHDLLTLTARRRPIGGGQRARDGGASRKLEWEEMGPLGGLVDGRSRTASCSSSAAVVVVAVAGAVAPQQRRNKRTEQPSQVVLKFTKHSAVQSLTFHDLSIRVRDHQHVRELVSLA